MLVLPSSGKKDEITRRNQSMGKLKCIPLSANVVRRCKENAAEDVKWQVLGEFMQCGRAALDESTDVPNMSRFVVHARFGIWEWNTQRVIIIIIFNELYREDIISITDDLFNKSAILWENSINITTDCGGFNCKTWRIPD